MSQASEIAKQIQILIDLGETPATEPMLAGLVKEVKERVSVCGPAHRAVLGIRIRLVPDLSAIEAKLNNSRIKKSIIPVKNSNQLLNKGGRISRFERLEFA